MKEKINPEKDYAKLICYQEKEKFLQYRISGAILVIYEWQTRFPDNELISITDLLDLLRKAGHKNLNVPSSISTHLQDLVLVKIITKSGQKYILDETNISILTNLEIKIKDFPQLSTVRESVLFSDLFKKLKNKIDEQQKLEQTYRHINALISGNKIEKEQEQDHKRRKLNGEKEQDIAKVTPQNTTAIIDHPDEEEVLESGTVPINS